ncbi:hypothetical protein [Streptomyces sp. NPDC048659]|uniref:hypothetical protein n=1 Tax=Streptomyces sp. NPDC048659 TaxID=3155489 RepID=UPI00343C2A9F
MRRSSVLVGRSVLALLMAFGSYAVLGGGSRPLEGNALDGAVSGAGYEHARVGDAWWVMLPAVRNRSGAPVEVIGVQVLDLPRGLRAERYAAFDADETGAPFLMVPDGSPEFPSGRYTDHSARPLRLAPGETSHVYPAVKVRVTGEVLGEPSSCRFTYARGADRFTQVLPCGFTLRLTPEEPEEGFLAAEVPAVS